MHQSVNQIFVYGSLRSGFHAPAFEYISRYFTLRTPAKVKGLLYDMGEYPAAIPTNDNFYIVGELYAIKHPEEFSWAMEQLDAYEGINSEPEDGMSFRRDLVTVYTPTDTTTAWVYWFNEPIVEKPIISSGDVLAYMLQKQKKG
jgi:gamma-glutamylcyclotransferase (GGCT)/AIG2-like uncharacterized protein YtfP